MWVKLIPVVHFTNILRAAFSPILFCQKIRIQILSRENSSVQKLFCKILLKFYLAAQDSSAWPTPRPFPDEQLHPDGREAQPGSS